MTDYRTFLTPQALVVLPYFGGTRVDALDRRLRVAGELAVGWWRFRIDGRRALPVELASPVELGALPRVRGHWVDGWIVIDGRHLVRIGLPPDDEPAPLARVCGRRWYSGDVVFDSLEYEDDAELAARRAFEEQRPLGELRDVPPSLRVAFGIALGGVCARDRGVAATVRELSPRAVAIADRGRDAVNDWLDELARARQFAAVAARRHAVETRLETAVGTARAVTRHADPVRRADDALDGANARMLSYRRLERGTRLDVTYEVDGTRIISMVDAATLQVIDPGICLAGAHRVLTLDAMPSVVREAFEEDHLNITRQP